METPHLLLPLSLQEALQDVMDEAEEELNDEAEFVNSVVGKEVARRRAHMEADLHMLFCRYFGHASFMEHLGDPSKDRCEWCGKTGEIVNEENAYRIIVSLRYFESFGPCKAIENMKESLEQSTDRLSEEAKKRVQEFAETFTLPG